MVGEIMNFVKIPINRGFTAIKYIYELIEPYGFIAGGYARYCASNNQQPSKTKDVDVFPHSKEMYLKLISVLDDAGFTIRRSNDVSVTYNRRMDLRYVMAPEIQIIKPLDKHRILTFGRPEEVLGNFDFTITRVAIDSSTHIIADEDFLKHEKKKQLVLRNIHCPISSMLRCCKYYKKGYFITPVESIKLFHDWMNRDEEYRTKVVNFLTQANIHKETGESTMSKEQVEEMEALLALD